MKRVNKHKLALALAVATTAFCAAATSLSASAMSGAPAISKSKIASPLKDWKSDIVLSMPADEEKLESDVVFVLDKSTSTDVENDALKMLADLRAQIIKTDADVKVGVVIFNRVATPSKELLDLKTEYSEIETEIKAEVSGGTNMHAGLLAGKELLASGKATNNRKYMIFVSDGIAYMYNSEPTVAAWGADQADTPLKAFAAPDNWNTKYGNDNPLTPAEWDARFAEIAANKDKIKYEYKYNYGTHLQDVAAIPDEKWTDPSESKIIPNSVDLALYYTKTTYDEICADINCYAVKNHRNNELLWGPSFMEYLANGEELSFEDIQNDIIYLVDAGSFVTDEMGSGKDSLGADYDFDFDFDSPFYVTVGDVRYDAVKLGENKYGFNKLSDNVYAYVMTYYPESEDQNDRFLFEINVPVEITKPLKFNYSAKLTNPVLENKTDKVQKHEDLLTNNSATLCYLTTGNEACLEDKFENPKVSYEVAAVDPGKGDAGEDKKEEAVEPEVKNPSTADEVEGQFVLFALMAFGLTTSAGYLVVKRLTA